MRRISLSVALLLSTTAPAFAQNSVVQNSAPQPVAIENTIPEARDVDYPGTIRLAIDATDTEQGIFRVRETIPVAAAGPMVLLYPAWLPGNHAPRGQIEKLTGLVVRANGQVVQWVRDPVDVFAFHLNVPEGARTLELEFQFTSAVAGNQGRIVVTPNLMNLQFQSMSLYPAGYFTRRIPVEATVTYPDGWTAVSGLPATQEGAVYTYTPTNYQVLVDSPVFAGRYYREWALSDRVDLNVFADNAAELAAATPEMIDAHRRLVQQAVAVFGSQQYDHYEFLLTVSDEIGGIGLEHHRSSENGVGLGYFTEWDKALNARDLLPHEYTHSWNGKYRRGADLWTPDYRMPMRNSLLWVYEGQTQFWGYVLAARSGMLSKQQVLDALAIVAASLDTRAGRNWRPLIDTTNDPVLSARRPKPWVSWQRSEDYYNEGLLVWLDADAKLRELTRGRRSIDDFARAFFGGRDGDYGEVTYTFDDVVATLNGIAPYDWAAFLNERLYATSDHAPLDGFTRNGYRLTYTDTPTPYFRNMESERGIADHSYSIGLVVGRGGNISSVAWDSPAFAAGLDDADDILAVNGMEYSADRLKDAIVAAATGTDPIRLTIKSGNRLRDVAIDYHGGLRYPRLEKTMNGEAGLDRLLAPR